MKAAVNRTHPARWQTTKRPDRIPLSLQAVFVSSNKGVEVHCPPPERVASKIFYAKQWFKSSFCSRAPARHQKSELQEVITPPAKLEKPEPTNECYAPTPQAYLNSILLARGYSTQEYPSLSSAYYNKRPTALQQASYGIRLLDATRQGDASVVRTLLGTGLSPNACNQQGESLVHAVCRRGQADMLRILLEFDCEIRVADDFGRTPLHDACWAVQPCLDVVELLLQADPRLFYIADARGSLPLAYVSKDHWTPWIKFFMAKKDMYWPERDIATLGVEEQPPLTLERPNSRPVPDPKRHIPMSLVTMVAAGKMEPEEAEYLMNDDPSETEVDDDDSEDSDSDSDSCLELDSDSDSDEDSDASEDEDDFMPFGEREMAHVAKSFMRAKPIEWTLPETTTTSLKSINSAITTLSSEVDENDDESLAMSSQTDSNNCDDDDEAESLGSSRSTLFDEDECALVLSSIGGPIPLTWSPAKRRSNPRQHIPWLEERH